MLNRSGLPEMVEHLQNGNGQPVSLYADGGYWMRDAGIPIIVPYCRANLTPQQISFNTLMSSLRIAVEWSFGDVINLWKYLDYAAQLKVAHQPVGTFYRVAVFLTNCYTSLHRNRTSYYFNCSPPSLEEYLQSTLMGD